MASPLVQLELALHDADCTTPHDDQFVGHGEKYAKLALVAVSVMPSDRDPYWLHDMKQMIEFIGDKVCVIESGISKMNGELGR